MLEPSFNLHIGIDSRIFKTEEKKKAEILDTVQDALGTSYIVHRRDTH